MVYTRTLLEYEKMDAEYWSSTKDFKIVQFWVQVQDLRCEKFSVENAQVIGDKIEQFLET